MIRDKKSDFLGITLRVAGVPMGEVFKAFSPAQEGVAHRWVAGLLHAGLVSSRQVVKNLNPSSLG